MITEKIEQAFEKYQVLANKENQCTHYSLNNFPEIESEILSPVQIDLLLQKIIQCNKITQITGNYVTKLIQNSYEAGHNKFEITTKKHKIIQLCDKIKGKPENPVELIIDGDSWYCRNLANAILTVTGDTNAFFASDSDYCIINIKGKTERCLGEGSENCVFNIEGDAGDDCGKNSIKSAFSIKGNAGNHLGIGAKDSEFNVLGEIADLKDYSLITGRAGFSINTYVHYNPKNCVFNVYNPDAFQKLKKHLPHENKLEKLEKSALQQIFEEYLQTKKIGIDPDKIKIQDLLKLMKQYSDFKYELHEKYINQLDQIDPLPWIAKGVIVYFTYYRTGTVKNFHVRGDKDFKKGLEQDIIWGKIIDIIKNKHGAEYDDTHFVQKGPPINKLDQIPAEIEKISKAQNELESAIEKSIEHQVKVSLK